MQTMTIKEFTKLYFDALLLLFSNVEFDVINDTTIEGRLNEKSVRIAVDNAYKEYLADPNSLDTVLNKYVAVANKSFAVSAGININRIVPVIKPAKYLEDTRIEAKKMGVTKNADSVFEKYNDQLIIAYAEDTGNDIKYLTPDDLKSLGIKPGSLRQLAIRNLDALLTSIKRKDGGGFYMIIAGGNYEASIVLLNDFLTKENFPVDGDIVVAIPNRDMLLITGSNNTAGISKIKALANNIFTTGNYKLSNYLYRWNGNIFEKYNDIK
jgi:uncharacterized protein YtpQ (UPF0354 family)